MGPVQTAQVQYFCLQTAFLIIVIRRPRCAAAPPRGMPLHAPAIDDGAPRRSDCGTSALLQT
jgi:hypothetical protein